MQLELGDVAPPTLAFGLIAGLSVGWVGGSVLAGRSLSEYLFLLPVLLGAGVAVSAHQTQQ